MKFSKKTICIVAVISLLILALLPNFTLSAIESMSSERTSNGARTADVTTAKGFDTIDDACAFYFGTTTYTSTYNEVTGMTTYSAGVNGCYITRFDGASEGVFYDGALQYRFDIYG